MQIRSIVLMAIMMILLGISAITTTRLGFGSTLSVIAAQEQGDDCIISIVQREADGNIYYEIIGNGFTPGTVEVKAINRRTNQGYIFLLTLVEDRFSGIYLGYDGENYYKLAPGKWRITARSSDCVAKTTLVIK
ncbi:MAG: hypothetical protein AB1489_16185 [Acidobacteriota bacterium]